MRKLGLLLLLLVGAVAAIVACGAQGFDPASKVNSVRMFATRVDKPYAKPGETVTLETLFTDARRDKPRAAKLYWIPIVCMNPRDDLYYLCFLPQQGDGGTRLLPVGPLADAGAPEAGAGAGAVDAGAGGGSLLAQIPTGVDLSPFLPQGTTFSFRMPDDAVQPRQGTEPYGLAYVFNILCAGKVVLSQRNPEGGPQQVPLECVDEENQKLPPSDYVIGIQRVYAYDTKTNTNPVIEKVTLDGQDVDPAVGLVMDKCVATKRTDCPERKIDVRVSDSSWEDNPSGAGGEQLKEQIWVAYYGDTGDFDNDARLLFDTRKGRISESDVVFRAPYDPVNGTVWAVVHDNRGGASWVVLPLHVK